MHTIHIGTSTYFLGSVLWMLVYRILPLAALENMSQLWTEIVAEYRTLGCPTQYSNLGISSFVDPAKPNSKYPKLKGRAAEIKWLAPCLRNIWERHRRPGLEEDEWVARALDTLCAMQELLDEDSRQFFMAVPQVAEFRLLIDEHLTWYCKLAGKADSVGDLLWTLAPKHHWLWHMGWKSQFLHPRRSACYQDEDFMKVVKSIVKACTASTPLHKVPLYVLHKYRWGMFFQYLKVR